MGEAEPIVSLAGVSVRYEGAESLALDDVTLTIGRGELVGVIGLNGAGKSTLGRLLNGIVPQLIGGEVRGQIRVEGADPLETPVREMARLVGVVLDSPEAQMGQPTVGDEVAFGLEGLGVEWGKMVRRVDEALRWVGLDGFGERDPMTLSGGEQQRVAIAAVVAMRPPVLFLDEPVSGLDPEAGRQVFGLVRRLNREEGTTVIVAEHDVELLAEHVDRVLVLDRGRLVADGPPARVFARLARDPGSRAATPQVTELAALLDDTGRPDDAGGSDLPVTVAAALDWLAARR